MNLMFKKVLRYFIPLIIFIFFIFILRQNWNQITHYSFSIQPFFFSVFLALLIATVIFSSWRWGKILEEICGKEISFADVLKVHLTSWILRYFPGKVGVVLGKVYLGHQKWGIPKKEILLSSAYEYTFITLTSLLIGGYAFFYTSFWPNFYSSIIFIGLLAFLLLPIFFPKLFYLILNFFLATLKRGEINLDKKISPQKLLTHLIFYLCNRLLLGIAFLFLSKSLITIKPEDAIFVISSFVLANIIGFLAFFSPGGLGVREGVLFFLLQNIFPLEIAIIISLLSRIGQISADVIFAVIIFFPKKYLFIFRQFYTEKDEKI